MATSRDLTRETTPQNYDEAEHALHVPAGHQHVNEHPQTGITSRNLSPSAPPGGESTVNMATAAQNSQEHEQDPNIVDWDGPNDPANPQNWYVTQ